MFYKIDTSSVSISGSFHPGWQMTDPFESQMYRLVVWKCHQYSCKIFEHFALQLDPVIEFIQLRSTPFKDNTILVPKLAHPPFWWKSNSTPSKSGSVLPDLN